MNGKTDLQRSFVSELSLKLKVGSALVEDEGQFGDTGHMEPHGLHYY